MTIYSIYDITKNVRDVGSINETENKYDFEKGILSEEQHNKICDCEMTVHELSHFRQSMQVGMFVRRDDILSFLRKANETYTKGFWEFLNKASKTNEFDYVNHHCSDRLYHKKMVQLFFKAEEIVIEEFKSNIEKMKK